MIFLLLFFGGGGGTKFNVSSFPDHNRVNKADPKHSENKKLLILLMHAISKFILQPPSRFIQGNSAAAVQN